MAVNKVDVTYDNIDTVLRSISSPQQVNCKLLVCVCLKVMNVVMLQLIFIMAAMPSIAIIHVFAL